MPSQTYQKSVVLTFYVFLNPIKLIAKIGYDKPIPYQLDTQYPFTYKIIPLAPPNGPGLFYNAKHTQSFSKL